MDNKFKVGDLFLNGKHDDASLGIIIEINGDDTTYKYLFRDINSAKDQIYTTSGGSFVRQWINLGKARLGSLLYSNKDCQSIVKNLVKNPLSEIVLNSDKTAQ